MIGHLAARARADRRRGVRSGFDTFLREQAVRVQEACRDFERARLLREMQAQPFRRADIELTEVKK